LANAFALNYSSMGLILRESSSGKFLHYGFHHNNNVLLVSYKWSSPTAFNSNYFERGISTLSYPGQPVFLKISDDNTNRIFSISFDGTNFFNVYTVGRTDFITSDEVGFGLESGQTAYPTGMKVLHWAEE
jgi:hypothetical protein